MSDIFGKTLGRYILLEQLGEGGMAKVYNAYDPRMDKNVAIKIILPSHQYSEVFLERFVLEAKSLAQLSHTNIVKVLDYGEENNQPYIVMDYVGGGTLKEHMNMPVPWEKAAAFLAPVARALEYVHGQRIIHRDVKPSNILIDNNNQPMLSDFGVVKLMEEEEGDVAATGVGIGTPDYMSPEQGTGKEADFHSDVYALGIVFFEMVTGQKPYSADTPMAVVIKHVTEPFPLPRSVNSELPPSVEQVILKAVQKDPEKRYQTMGEFAEALEQLARGKKADLKKIKKLTLVQRPGQARLRYALAVVVVIALLVVGITGWKYLQPRPVVKPQPPLIILQTRVATSLNTQVVVVQATPMLEKTQPATIQKPTSTARAAALAPVSRPYQANAEAVLIQNDPLSSRVPARQSSEIARWGMGGANSVDWSPDGKSVLVGTTSGVYVFDAATLAHEMYLDQEKANWTEKAIYSLDGQRVYATSRSGKTLVYDVRTGNLDNVDLSELSIGYRLPNSESERLKDPNLAKTLALTLDSTGRNLAIGHENGSMMVWSLNENQVVLNVNQPPTVTDLAFSIDGRYLYTCSQESVIRVWDVAAGKQEDVLPQKTRTSLIEMSKDGSFFLTSGDAQTVYYWDAIEEKILYTFNYLNATPTSLAISSDGQLLAFGLTDGRIKVFAAPTPGSATTIRQELFTFEGHTGSVTSLVFSPDGQQLASTSWKEGLRIWDTSAGSQTQALNLSEPQITDLRFSPDGRSLAVEDASGRVRLWDVYQAKPIYSFDGYLPDGSVFSPHSDLLVIAQAAPQAWAPGNLIVINVSSGELVETLPGYVSGWQIYFNPNQTLLIEGNMQSAMIWEMSIWQKLNLHGGPNTGCGRFFTPDNRLLAVISDIGIFETVDQRILSVCAPRPNGTVLSYYNYDRDRGVYTVNDGMIFVSNPRTLNVGWLRTNKTLWDHKEIFISGSQDLYAYARDNQTLQIGNVSNRSVFFMPWYGDYKFVAAFSPKDNLVALGSKFGSIHIYAVQ